MMLMLMMMMLMMLLLLCIGLCDERIIGHITLVMNLVLPQSLSLTCLPSKIEQGR
mgnify:CR=1 FL=1